MVAVFIMFPPAEHFHSPNDSERELKHHDVQQYHGQLVDHDRHTLSS